MTTLNDLISTYNALATTAGLPTRKSFDSKAKAEAAIAALKPARGARLKIASAERSIKIREKGPRGFKFGPKWLDSIREAAGIALKPQNLPKLKDTAIFYNVKIDNKMTQDKIVEVIAQAL